MKKLLMVSFMVLSMAALGNEEVIIDKEVTGVNKEQLERVESKSQVNLEKNLVKIEDKNISDQSLKEQKQIIQVGKDQEEIRGELVQSQGRPIWKYVLGVVGIIVLGVAL